MTKSQLTLFCLISLMTSSGLYGQNATTVTIDGSKSVVAIPNNTATVVDSFITLTANGNISGATVSITGSYTSGDVLAYNGGTLPSGVTVAAFNTATRSLVFSGTTTPANWQDILRHVTLKTTSAVCNPESRLVSFVVGIKYYNILNGHFYEYYGTNTSWTNAKAYISSLSYFGREGYMATLTSQSENSFASVLIGQNSWIGCSDNYLQINAALGYTAYANQAAADGNFYWITGPDRGLKISSQNAWGSGGVLPVSGSYNNWTSGEPNDWPNYTTSSPGEEDYGHMYSGSALWNDFANTQSIGSIIEFGGMPNDNTSSQVVVTRSVYINGAPSGTITGGNTTVCPGTNSTTLTLTGLTGSVVRWESSLDNFLTAGTTISNTSTSLTVTNISNTTYYRAIVNTSSGCSNLNTSSTPIYVSSTVAGNIVAANNTICAGSSASFNLFGHSGSVVKWQMATNATFTTGVVNISNTTTAMSYTLASIGTYYFRAVVQNNGCGSPANTPSYTITVVSGTSPVGGTVSSAQHCGGSNSGSLSLSGHTGSVQKWQYSVDNGVIWTDIANTSTTQAYTSVTANRLYRAVITNGSCGTTYSNSGSITVFGTTVTRWDGGVSTDWQNSSNWCGGVADNGIDVIISSSASNELVLDQNRIIGKLNFNSSNKKIDIGNYTLTASEFQNYNSNNFVKTSGSGLIKINISNGQSKTFPIGESSYNPISITNNTGSSDYLSVRVFNEVYNDGYSGFTSTLGRVKRTWDIHKTNANGGSGLNFYMEWNIADVDNLISPALYHYTSGAWDKQTGSASSTATSFTYTGYTGTFSPFAIGSGLTPLPLELVDFTLEKQIDPRKVELKWTTSSEVNCDHFEVMRQKDGGDWQSIGSIQTINKYQLNKYAFTDEFPGISNLYRLKMVDKTGKSTYYPIKNADFRPLSDVVKIYPNPAVDQIHIETDEKIAIRLMDVNGRVIMSQEMEKDLLIGDLSKGIYFLEVVSGSGLEHFRIILE